MPADVIFTHANVQTLDPVLTTHEAIAVHHGHIMALGTNDEMRALADKDTRQFYLGGATLIPGFFDAHCHILGYGLVLGQIDLTAARSVADVLQTLAAAAPQETPRGWLRARGYDHNTFPEQRHPNRHDLDALGPDIPIYLTHASGHAAALNTRALQLCNITKQTPNPPGGTIVRDAQGDATGVLLEAAISLADAAAPVPNQTDKRNAILRAAAAMNAMGITSAVDAGTALSDLSCYQQAAENGELTLRCCLMPLLPELQNGTGGNWRTPGGLAPLVHNETITLGPAKLYSDGAFGTRTALLRAPYADNAENYGTAMWEAEQLNWFIGGAHHAGWQIAIHAIGDAAIDICLNAYEQTAASHDNRRHRIEHAMLLHDDQIARMNALGVVPVFQPEFISRFGDAYLTALGETRAKRLMPYKSTQQMGLPLVFSSDLPVVPGAPLDGIHAAVERITPSGKRLDAAQSVSVADALRAYTHGAAWSVFAERDRGSLVPGYRADFAILTADPLVLPLSEWSHALRVQATIVGGEVVFGHL